MSVTVHREISRNSLTWILVTNVAAIAPHVIRLPYWLIAICVGCLLYRVMVFRGIGSFPNKWWCAFLVLSGGVGIFLHYGINLGPEAGVALLIMSFAMKMLEMNRFRNAYIQLILTYFVVATEFLFNSSFYMTLYLYGVMLMITAALIGLSEASLSSWKMLRLSFFLSMQALPVMLILFIFFPRISPLWALNMTGPTETVGLRESMTPADIAKLGRMDRRAFRAEFFGNIPDQEQLYWRGLVFSEFDGRTWSVSENYSSLQRSNTFYQLNISVEQPGVEYSVMLEPTDQTHLFALDMPQVYQSGINFNRDFTLTTGQPIAQLFIYSVRSFLHYQAQPTLTDRQRVRELQFPSDTNPRSQALAKKWMQEVGGDPEQLTQKILQWFGEDQFIYTLSPPALKNDIVDRFLFDTKQGYCSFYAGALVFLLRSAGVPSRVVVGYMGGEINPLGHYVVVNQYDAHAWAEVWLEAKGWVRVDPTAAVAPERIRDSVQRGLSEKADFLKDYPLSLARYRHSALLRQMWRSIDYASFSWQRAVVGYDEDRQQALLKHYFKNVSALSIALGLFAVVMCLLGVLAWWLLHTRKSSHHDVLDRAYVDFCGVCAQKGLTRKPGETPYQFARRLRPAMPTKGVQIDEITQLYMQQQYQASASPADRQSAVKRLRQLAKMIGRP